MLCTIVYIRSSTLMDANRVSGNSATTCLFFYEEIDAILGTHATSAPAMLLDADDTVVVPTEGI